MREWMISFGAAFVLFFIALYGRGPRIHALVRSRTDRILQTHFESKIEFSDFRVSLFPRVRPCRGRRGNVAGLDGRPP